MQSFASFIDLSHSKFSEAFAQLPFVSEPDVLLGKVSPAPDSSAPPPGGLASRTVVACEACHRAKACCQNERPCRRCIRLNKGQCRDRVVKERKTTVACVNCWKAKSGCDSSRPCSRCVRLGKESECVDRTHKKSGRPRKDQSAKATADSPPKTKVEFSLTFVTSAHPLENAVSATHDQPPSSSAPTLCVPKLESQTPQNASSTSSSAESGGSFVTSNSPSADSHSPYIGSSLTHDLQTADSFAAESSSGSSPTHGYCLVPKVESRTSASAPRSFSALANSNPSYTSLGRDLKTDSLTTSSSQHHDSPPVGSRWSSKRKYAGNVANYDLVEGKLGHYSPLSDDSRSSDSVRPAPESMRSSNDTYSLSRIHSGLPPPQKDFDVSTLNLDQSRELGGSKRRRTHSDFNHTSFSPV